MSMSNTAKAQWVEVYVWRDRVMDFTALGKMLCFSLAVQALMFLDLHPEGGGTNNLCPECGGGGGGVWGCSTSPCLELAVHWVRCRRGIPTTSYVVLTTGAFCTTPSHSDRGRSEVCQQLRGESSTFELPEEEEPLLGLLHQVGCVCVWTKWGQMYCGCPGTWCLPTLHLLPVDVQKGMFHPPESPDFHSDLLGRAGVHHKVVAWAPSCQVLDLLSSVSNMRPTAVVSSANLTTTLVGGSGSAVMAEQVQRGDFIFYAKS